MNIKVYAGILIFSILAYPVAHGYLWFSKHCPSCQRRREEMLKYGS